MPKKGKAGRPKGSVNKPKQTMKKVSGTGAYKKSVKNQMMMRRAPIVETKQRVHSDVAQINGYPAGDGLDPTNPLNWRTLQPDDAFTSIPLRSWHRIQHGFNENECIGNSIFSKFLNFKLQVRFPEGKNISLPNPSGTGTYQVKNKMIQRPTKLYLVCGWITESLNYPLNSDVSPSLPAQSDATQNALQSYITQQLKPFFDDDEDKLQFRPKQTTNIKIEKYVAIAPDLSSAIGTQAVPEHQFADSSPNIIQVQAHGSIPEVYRSWSTKTMRKLPLTEGLETSFTTDKQNLYPNNSWVPFAVIYNPNYEQQAANFVPDATKPGQYTQVQFMEYRYNDAHYYTDS